MTPLTRTIIPGIGLFLLLTCSCLASNIAIIESKSFHPLQVMDNTWLALAQASGHTASILPQNALDQVSSFANYDVVIISNGLIDLSTDRQVTLQALVSNGKNLYIQSEYEITHPGNLAFSNLVNNLGGQFTWTGTEEGGIAPINILSPINNNLNDVHALNYFWYGTYGTGDATIQPILENAGQHWGFIFNSNDVNHGKILTTSDQDWIRIGFNEALLANILAYLTTPTVANILPTVSIEMISDNSCAGDLYRFEASIQDNLPEVMLQWQINGIPVNGATQSVFETTTLASGDVVECVLTLSNTPSYEYVSNPLMIDAIFPLQDPSIEVVANQASFCENESMDFTANLSDVEDVFNLSYQWTLNGEAVAGANTLQLSLTSLTAADQISCLLRYDNDCTVGNEITADPINAVIETAVTPSLFLQASANTICAGTQVSFSASGSHWGAQPQFSWQIDGNPVGQNSPTFATDALLDGQTVTCVLNVEETCVSTSTVTAQGAGVTVLPALDPTISISANTNRICVSTPVTFTAAGSHWGTQAQLRWMIDQVPVSGEQATTFTTSDLLPNQSVSCAVISNADCSPANEIVAEPISIEVDMGDTPTVQISADNDQVCSGTAITFTASGEHWGTQANFQWWVDGQMVGDNRPTFQSTALLDGQIVRCTVLSSQECVSTNEAQSNALTVTIAALEIAVEEVLSETCQLANGWIEVGLRGGVAPFEFAWSNGGSESFISDLKAGDYDLTVTDATGCSATIQVVLPAEDQPSIDQLAIQQPVCQAERGRANVTMSNDGHEYTYRWLDDNNFIRSKSAEVEGLDAGVYHLEITNEYGCSTRETFHIQPASSLEVSTTLERQVILGAQTRLNAAVNTNAAVSFEWFPSAGLSCTDCEDPMVAPTASTVYTVVVTNEWGCSAESSVIVKVIPNDEVYVPNAFSPNGDGINDFFTVFGGSHVASIKSMRIIDRWGATLFAGTDLPINSERTGWNGSANGKTLRTGVYVYQVEIQFIDGKTKVLQGDLTLVQ